MRFYGWRFVFSISSSLSNFQANGAEDCGQFKENSAVVLSEKERKIPQIPSPR